MHKQSVQYVIGPHIVRVLSFISDEKSQVIFCHSKRPVFDQSLRTTSRSSKKKSATILSPRSDEQWLMLRIKDTNHLPHSC